MRLSNDRYNICSDNIRAYFKLRLLGESAIVRSTEPSMVAVLFKIAFIRTNKVNLPSHLIDLMFRALTWHCIRYTHCHLKHLFIRMFYCTPDIVYNDFQTIFKLSLQPVKDVLDKEWPIHSDQNRPLRSPSNLKKLSKVIAASYLSLDLALIPFEGALKSFISQFVNMDHPNSIFCTFEPLPPNEAVTHQGMNTIRNQLKESCKSIISNALSLEKLILVMVRCLRTTAINQMFQLIMDRVHPDQLDDLGAAVILVNPLNDYGRVKLLNEEMRSFDVFKVTKQIIECGIVFLNGSPWSLLLIAQSFKRSRWKVRQKF